MSMRIVIIEDEYYTRQAIKKYIQQLGEPYEVIGEARNGQEGLELIRSMQPDLSLVDITMPIMDGIEMITAARDAGLQTLMVILTGYSEFGYAQAAVKLGVCDYLLKPLRIEDLSKCLERAAGLLYDKQAIQKLTGLNVGGFLKAQLAELLMYQTPDSVEAGLLIDYLGFPADSGIYYVIMIQIGNAGSENPSPLPAIASVIEEAGAKNGQHILISMIDSQTICVLLNAPAGTTSEQLSDLMKNALDTIHTETPTQLKISIGNGVDRLNQISEAYLSAQMCQMRYMFDRGRDIAIYTAEESMHETDSMMTPEFRREFQKLLLGRNADKALRSIDECFQKVERSNAVKSTVYALAIELTACIMQFQHDQSAHASVDTGSRSLPALPLSAERVEELHDYVRQYAESVLRDNHGGGAYVVLVKKIHEYIDRHFADPTLRLEDIAHANALSIQHMCMIYKQTTQSTIGDYLFHARMEHAKQLIARGERNVSMLAEACGYEDPSYFSRCFRKHFGVTPRAFIENMVQ